MNWVLLGSTVMALPLLLLFPERYRRTDLDITIDVPSSEDEIGESSDKKKLINGTDSVDI